MQSLVGRELGKVVLQEWAFTLFIHPVQAQCNQDMPCGFGGRTPLSLVFLALDLYALVLHVHITPDQIRVT
jgi:hypothetical protein